MCSDENNDPDCGKLKTDYCDEECTEVQEEKCPDCFTDASLCVMIFVST